MKTKKKEKSGYQITDSFGVCDKGNSKGYMDTDNDSFVLCLEARERQGPCCPAYQVRHRRYVHGSESARSVLVVRHLPTGLRCRWSVGFPRGSPVSPVFHSGAAPYLPRFTLIGSQDLNYMGIVPDDATSRGFIDLPFPLPLNSGAALYSPPFILIGSQDLNAKSSPNRSTQRLTRISNRGFLATEWSGEIWAPLKNEALRADAGETRLKWISAGPKGRSRVNPSTRGIVRQDSRVRKSGSEPAMKRTRFASMGGQRPSRHTFAAQASVGMSWLAFVYALNPPLHVMTLLSHMPARERNVAQARHPLAKAFDEIGKVCAKVSPQQTRKIRARIGPVNASQQTLISRYWPNVIFQNRPDENMD
ncbi:hypothetical protein PR048_013615 [Dryococelus australis]|uniref:Uncharacterized protein n=1 Tax=Dryococelus australis TaxID=614101 RepID=A0ABQ9HSN8_9NEOP|nr:hypothetical protein PR048_013615 [Dryococelus australis]